ncbi:MAG TPA: hypothetical protein P5089_03285 [Candidatus Portnoybacteria bacterium]|nr:hypothetical protein [Candidatus Portnoybacteria bacterium]
MQTQTVGFFTKQSAESWFLEFGDQTDVLAKKEMVPKGDGTPHLIMKLVFPDELGATFYPNGKIMDRDFEEYDGKLL